jgi:hypothetical protein
MADGYFDDLVGPLKRAAVDAYMTTAADFGNFRIEGDEYISRGSEGGSIVETRVTRPGPDGAGGGEVRTIGELIDLGAPEASYHEAFDHIRWKIDSTLARWRTIPEPGPIGDKVESLRQAHGILSVGAVQNEGKVTGGGNIAGTLNTILVHLPEAMAGGRTVATFKSKFLGQLGKAISGHEAIVTILGGHLTAQWKMWWWARRTVTDIVSNTTKAFNAAATGAGNVDWQVALKVVGWAVKGAILFTPQGKAAKAVGATDLGLTILNDAIPWPKTKQPAPDYQAVMAAFVRDLNELETKIQSEEQTIRANIVTNLDQIWADQRHRGSYDLSRPGILDVDDADDLGQDIDIDPPRVREITNTWMPDIADELGKAKGYLGETVDLMCLQRDASIGLGQYGPADKFHELRHLGWELLENLAWEVRTSAKSLELAVEDMKATDSSRKDALEKHHEKIKDQGRADAWSNPWR